MYLFGHSPFHSESAVCALLFLYRYASIKSQFLSLDLSERSLSKDITPLNGYI
jgi:hypothetical protein